MKKFLLFLFVIAIFAIGGLYGYKKLHSDERKNESHTDASFGFCKVSNPETTLYFHPITYEPALAGKKDYSVAITQSSAEVAEFKNFFKKGF